MKKLFFTAIALVAFSGVSMAKTGEVEIKQETKSDSVLSVCSDIYLATWTAAVENGANDRQAARVAWVAYDTCVKKSLSLQ